MEDDHHEHQRSMSLVPFAPAEARQVVSRHGSAVVVFDEDSKQLSLRHTSTAVDATSCPYCNRPYREPSPQEQDGQDEHDHLDPDAGYVSSSYFQMLSRSRASSTAGSRPPSPHKQLAPATLQGAGDDYGSGSSADSTGSPRHHGISARAFSPNYFKTFFVEERELGRGGKGVVLLVRHVLDGVNLGRFACKRVPVGDDHEWLEKVLIEVQLLQNLSHENLVSYRHVWLEDYKITNFGPSVPCAFILQQYCNGGDLQDYVLEGMKTTVTTEQLKERMRRRSKGQLEDPSGLSGPRRMPFDEIISFFKDITSGLNFLHANGYVHRDLKPNNCLLHRTGRNVRVLVSDFGEMQAANVTRKSTGATGTISYCAPEVLRPVAPGGPLGNFTTKSDIFSLGMIVYFMCFARLPYTHADGIDEDKEDIDQLRAEISSWQGFDDARRARSDLPEKLYQSLKRLLALKPRDRPGTEEILRALKSPSALDEFSQFSGPSGLDDIGSRILPADTPSPSPQGHRQKTSINYTKPGRSKLGTSALERSPSPSNQQAIAKSPMEEESIVLRPRKIDLPPPRESSVSPDPSPRLLLPPPDETMTPGYHQLSHSLPFLAAVKIAFFLMKVYTLLTPCQPYIPAPRVTYPLLLLASLDFLSGGYNRTTRNGVSQGLGRSMLLLLVHTLVVGTLLRWDGLCSRRRVTWEELS
ncbi:kinase-like protein [Westerdykella ornata]|uniref:non-specific serine/threonine protein kinase n=1 Tax=Westerdykella ornata TaxID=318751 RepID=A0A6A6JEK4_WESOR|nr:kinase-like protein [Westerdykella ornata]KAF2274695.1 kinase-like protein [Westerdykella ornata]